MKPHEHEAVTHSVGEYVRGMAHTNGIELFWSMFKLGYQETYHHMSTEHLHRYVDEFAGRHNVCDEDTIEQLRHVAACMVGKHLRYVDLVS